MPYFGVGNGVKNYHCMEKVMRAKTVSFVVAFILVPRKELEE